MATVFNGIGVSVQYEHLHTIISNFLSVTVSVSVSVNEPQIAPSQNYGQ